MADTLRRLVNTSAYNVLQEKLEAWYKDYHLMSCDQNLNRCCELVELTSKVQGQLFTILSLTAREGGQYAGVDTLKSRFLPWLGSSFFSASSGVTTDTSLNLIQESMEKEKKIRELSNSHEQEMQKMETQLSAARLQLDTIKQELADGEFELNDMKNRSAATLLASEDEILQLKADLRASRDQADMYKRKLDVLDDFERQIRMLKDEVSYLTAEKSLLQDRITRSRSSSPLPRRSRSPSPLPFLRSDSPTRAQLTNASRHSRLVTRFTDIYANERLDAQNLLSRYIDDLEMVQRILFISTVESFHAAKMAFRQFKLRVRKTLSPTHIGQESLDDAVLNYIVHNLDLYDVQSSVNDVIRAMNVNPKISFPPEIDFILISSFIREMCRLAFAMQTLEPPLDLAFTTDGELYSESKYRRSYDSEFTAPLVAYHVWPALMEGNDVIVKGEAFTKRGALWSPRRSRSSSPIRSRGSSPSRALASTSRSSSPSRLSPKRL
ncbi:mitochondria-eating protein [Acipenser oxyrinchus oxyrinchus]|uniref:Mitochondria-eating protein n=1 Tax=Acipenser oxyrinchus oxyrinchus TaxID=40147 RepID=A0AAD8GHW4_ACIOX|nr:mitochondria-eating protein [Acipenser oxyrinchus oxyrinchus]